MRPGSSAGVTFAAFLNALDSNPFRFLRAIRTDTPPQNLIIKICSTLERE